MSRCRLGHEFFQVRESVNRSLLENEPSRHLRPVKRCGQIAPPPYPLPTAATRRGEGERHPLLLPALRGGEGGQGDEEGTKRRSVEVGLLKLHMTS